MSLSAHIAAGLGLLSLGACFGVLAIALVRGGGGK